METRRFKMSSRNPLAESSWLSLALLTLFALPHAVLATPPGTLSPQKFGAYAATASPTQLAFLFEVNTTGDGDRVSRAAT